MTDLSFTVTYTKCPATPPARAIECEKCFASMNEALDFCVRLSCLSGQARSVTQMIRGVEDAVLDDDALSKEIARRRGFKLAW